MHMRKLLFTAAGTLTVGILLLGTTAAQTAPASTQKPATTSKTGTDTRCSGGGGTWYEQGSEVQETKQGSRKKSDGTTVPVVTTIRKVCLDGSWKELSRTTSGKTTQSNTKAETATTAAKTPAPLTLTTQKDKISYAIGLNIGESMKKDSLDIDPAILSRAIKDAMTGGKPAMSEVEAKSVITAFRTEMMKKQQAKTEQAGEANKQAGEKFLAENKAKPGVVTLPSGLQYKIIKEGDGPKPTASDTVVTNYRGTLIDGTEFDSSYKRGEPATFPVGQVIKGWTEALQLMPVGSKWQLYIPANLAYGERSPGAEIGPNSTLIFDIELLSIQDKKPEAKQ
jgi:FKBP-type peptidyl-prolyl cis-trans isomerase FklB